MSKIGQHFQSRIARRLLKQVTLFSLLLALLFTGVQAVLDYRNRLTAIHRNMEQVERFHIDGIVTALWNFNQQELASQVDGILHFRYFSYVAVTDRDAVIVQAGTKLQKNSIDRSIPLVRRYKDREVLLGVLHLQADRSRARTDSARRLAVMFLLEAGTVTLVALLLVLLFDRLVTRHLSTAANYFRNFNIHTTAVPLRLDKERADDELDILADSFNSMRENVSLSYQKVLVSEQELRDRERLLQAITDGSPSMIFLKDPEGRYITVNERLEELLGMPREEVKGKTDYDLFPPAIAELYRAHDRQVLENKQPIQTEERFLGAGGTERMFLSNKFPLFASSGEIYAICGISHDITLRKKAETALRTAEKRFRDLLEAIRLGAVMLDCDGNITFCNKFLLDLTGWSLNEVLGRNWFDLFIPDEGKETLKSIFRAAIVRADFPENYENLIRTRQGDQKLIAWNNSLLRDGEGGIVGIASIGIDITEHRKLEVQLRQSQKMEAVGHLAGGVAHDFNNILTAIIGYGSILRKKIPQTDPLRFYVDQVLASSDRAVTLTHSLLAFSRKQTIAPKPHDINEIVLDFRKIVERIIGEDVEFKINIGGKDLVAVVDKGQMEQVLLNLVTNARDAMQRGGTLTISTQKAEINEAYARDHDLSRAGHYARISVVDTGIGMDKKIQEQIFEPFFTTKEVGKGTGLGLSMVYGMVKQHNGFINVSSEPGQGAMFNIYLPLHGTQAESDTERGLSSIPPGSETVLLVEDDARVREVTGIILQESGYSILEARDGEDGLQVFRENREKIQLVLCDVIMPKRNGKDLYDEIIKIKPGIKVLFMSGYTADVISTRGLLQEGMNFVSKPVQPHELLRKVRDILDNY